MRLSTFALRSASSTLRSPPGSLPSNNCSTTLSFGTSFRSSSRRRTSVELPAMVGPRPTARYITATPAIETSTARKRNPTMNRTPRLATCVLLEPLYGGLSPINVQLGTVPTCRSPLALLQENVLPSCRSRRGRMGDERLELPQGTLDLLILRTLALGPQHG